MSLPADFRCAGFELPAVRCVPATRPLHWLRAGWQDLRANPLPSLAYGLLFALGGDMVLLTAFGYPYLVMVAVSGFFLLAPLLAAGLYELSRSLRDGEKLLFIDSLRCYRRNGESLAFFGVVLAIVALMWERLSALAFALLGMPDGETLPYLGRLLFGGEHTLFLAAWLALGACLAVFVFALAVVAVPLLLDRDVDVATAMMSSLTACAANPAALLLWAALIVGLTLAGFATLLFGLIVVMPVLGHASWHAYRELVE